MSVGKRAPPARLAAPAAAAQGRARHESPGWSMADVFISYARSTSAQAQAVAEGLRAVGYDVWRDDQLPANRSYGEVIEEQLQAAKAVVVIWSAEAVKSQWGVGVAALAALGEADRAKDWMRRALLVDPDNLVMRYNFACALARSLADPDGALTLLGSVLERDGPTRAREAVNDPDFASLRDDPRFQAMIAAAEARLAAGNSADEREASRPA